MTAATLNAATLNNAAVLTGSTPINTGTSLMARVMRELRYRVTVRQLHRLDNATLADIGIERAEIPDIAARSTGRFF